jgi:hypothetical protein
MKHAVDVSASSLCEAAVLGLCAFERSEAAYRPCRSTRLTATVRSETERHEVSVAHVEDWLGRQGKTPKEQALKARLRTA